MISRLRLAGAWLVIFVFTAGILLLTNSGPRHQHFSPHHINPVFVGGIPVPFPPNANIPGSVIAPSMAGTTTQGQTLTETPGRWTDGPIARSYQWEQCNSSGGACTFITNATNQTYVLTSGDVTHTIRVIETATNAIGSTATPSAQSASIAASGGTPPVNTVVPTISGTTTQGQVLSSTTGSWTNTPTSYAYQWLDCDAAGGSCSNIGGATSSTYTLTVGDVGNTIVVSVTATNASGTGSASSVATAVVASSGGGGGGFVNGVCSPNPCTQASSVNYQISYADTSAAPICAASCGTGSPKTITDPISIERPNNLSTATQVPAVITTCTSVGGSPDWAAAAPTDKFVWVYMPSIMNGGAENTVCKYLHTSTGWQGIGQQGQVDCGTNSDSPCDLVPKLLATLSAIECVGSPPCENVNPNEVFMSGASEGGQGVASFACDTRTSGDLAGVQVISDPLISPARINTGLDASATNNIPANCPAIQGVGTHCYWDCISVSANKNITWQWAYGTADNTWGGSNYSCPTSPCSDSLDKGSWRSAGPQGALPDFWFWGEPDTAKKFDVVMGCSTTPASTTTTGNTGKILTKTYTPCSGSSTPAATAMQTISITGATHLPDTWPAGTNLNGSDGFSEPAQAWAFWTTYFN